MTSVQRGKMWALFLTSLVFIVPPLWGLHPALGLFSVFVILAAIEAACGAWDELITIISGK